MLFVLFCPIVASGVNLYRIVADGFTDVKKLVLIK